MNGTKKSTIITYDDKGYPHYIGKCIDCGEIHDEGTKRGGLPRYLRCNKCAAKLRGGHIPSIEERIRISAKLMGHKVSEKTKESLRLMPRELKSKGGYNKAKLGLIAWNKGMKVSSPETLEKMRIAGKKCWDKEGMREKQSERMKGKLAGEKHPQYGKHPSIETLRKMFVATKRLSNYNKTERALDEIIQRILPNQYKYNGGGQLGFRIYWHIPDFVNIDGQKKIIEMNGCLWHCCEQCNIQRHPMKKSVEFIRNRDKKHIEEAKKLGYKVLTIWEHDMGNEKLVIEKLLSFNNE